MRGYLSSLSPGKRAGLSNKIHVSANNKLHNKIKHKLWPKASVCVLCGSTDRVQWHHDDYDYPFEVVELCQAACHTMADQARREREAAHQ